MPAIRRWFVNPDIRETLFKGQNNSCYLRFSRVSVAPPRKQFVPQVIPQTDGKKKPKKRLTLRRAGGVQCQSTAAPLNVLPVKASNA